MTDHQNNNCHQRFFWRHTKQDMDMQNKVMILAGGLLALSISPASARPPLQNSPPPTSGVVLPGGSASAVQSKSAPPVKSTLVPDGPTMRPHSNLGSRDALREALRKPVGRMAGLSVERIEASKMKNGKTYAMKVVGKNFRTESAVSGPTGVFAHPPCQCDRDRLFGSEVIPTRSL